MVAGHATTFALVTTKDKRNRLIIKYMELVFLACFVGKFNKKFPVSVKNRLKYQILFIKRKKKSLGIPNKHKKLLIYNHTTLKNYCFPQG